jgi:hypothetical protein
MVWFLFDETDVVFVTQLMQIFRGSYSMHVRMMVVSDY